MARVHITFHCAGSPTVDRDDSLMPFTSVAAAVERPATRRSELARPTKPLILKDRVIRVTIDAIDAQGLDAVSLEVIARRLGVSAPALYHHFKDKRELLAGVARLVLMESETPDIREIKDWRERLVKLSISARRSILQHPKIAPLLLRFFPRHLLLPAYDRAVGLYEVPVEVHMLVLEGVEKITMGFSLFAAASRSEGIEPMPAFDPEALPHLAAAVRGNPYDEEGLFAEAIRSFLRGLPTSERPTAPADKIGSPIQ